MSPTPPTPQSDIPITPNPVGNNLIHQGLIQTNNNTPNNNNNSNNNNNNNNNNNSNNNNNNNTNSNVNNSTESSKIRKRSPNWLVQEEEQLASSWLLISQLPEFSSNPSGEAFFSRVAEDFNKHSKFHFRDADQMKTRWGSLNTSTLKFSAIYNRIEQNPPHGTSHADWMRMAKQMYYDQNKGHSFRDEAAWEKLRHAPKWNQQSSSSSSSSTNPNSIDFSKSFGDHNPQNQNQAHHHGDGSIAVVRSSMTPNLTPSMTPINYHQLSNHQSRSDEPKRLKRRAEDEIGDSHRDDSEVAMDEVITQQILDQSNSWLSNPIGAINRNPLSSSSSNPKQLQQSQQRRSSISNILNSSNINTINDLEKSKVLKESMICEVEFKKSQAQLNDLTILKTSESEIPDEVSKEALRLMKARIKRRYEKVDEIL